MQQNFFDPEEHLDSSIGIDPSAFFTIDEPEDTDSLPTTSDLHEGGLAASTEAFNQAMALLSIRKQIVAQNGLGLPEVMSVESHVPGLLQYRAPNKFTYERSDVNLAWSLEAIDGKLKSLMTAANAFFMRIITAIRTRGEALINRIKKGNVLNRLQAMQTAIRSKSTIIGFDEAVNYLGGESQFMAHFNRFNVASAFNNAFKSDLSVDDLKRIRTGDGVGAVVNILSGKDGQAPDDYNNLYGVELHLTSSMTLIALLKGRLESAKMMFDPRFGDQAGAKAHDGNDLIKVPEPVDLKQIGKVLNTKPNEYSKLLDRLAVFSKKIAELESDMKKLDGLVSTDHANVVESYNKWRTAFETSLTELNSQMTYVAACLTFNAAAITTISSIMACMSHSALTKSKEQHKGETTV